MPATSGHLFNEGLASCLRTIALAPEDLRLRVFENQARDAMNFVCAGGLEREIVIDKFQDAAVSTGLVAAHGQDTVQAIMARAIPMLPSPSIVPEVGIDLATDEAVAPSSAPPRIAVVDASTLYGKLVPPRQFLCEPMIPARNVTLLTGDGGTGKSLAALQLAFAAATALTWFGMAVQPGDALYLSAEDELDEVHRRLADISRHHGVSFAGLGSLHILPLAGEDAILAAPTAKTNIIATTTLWEQLVACVESLKPSLIVLDTLADLFAGDENQRSQARQFISLLRGLALKHNLTVLVLAHPSLTGIAHGTGSSGSTGWSNSVRSRLFLSRIVDKDRQEPDADVRVLRTTKANYGRVGDEIRVRWSKGVFVREQGSASNGLDRLAGDQMADQIFLDCLTVTLAQGRQFSPSKCSTYAPACFARMPEAKGYHAKVLALAMERLLSAGKLKIDTNGPPSKQRQFITMTTQAEEAA